MPSGPAIAPAPGLVIRLRPTSPWRFGPDSGARDRVDPVCHSDTVYAAVCSAMNVLGYLPEWLADTAQRAGGSAVRFSSCFPSLDDTLYAPPPMTLWPPAPTPRVRWAAARFVPLGAVETLLSGQPLREDAWMVDGESGCLLPTGRGPKGGPFRTRMHSGVAVDRVTGARVEAYSAACIEFAPGGGVWLAVEFQDDAAGKRWAGRVEAAFRVLADSGIGGGRSRGWGRFEIRSVAAGELPGLLLRLPAPEAPAEPVEEHAGKSAYWLLSLFNPASGDGVDWELGAYSLVTRAGRVESPVRWGDSKRLVRMVAEGSVVVAREALSGAAPDVAPEQCPHPVYRAGFALGVAIPWKPPAPPLPRLKAVEAAAEEPQDRPEPAPGLAVEAAPGVVAAAVSSAAAEEPEAVSGAAAAEVPAGEAPGAVEGLPPEAEEASAEAPPVAVVAAGEPEAEVCAAIEGVPPEAEEAPAEVSPGAVVAPEQPAAEVSAEDESALPEASEPPPVPAGTTELERAAADIAPEPPPEDSSALESGPKGEAE